MVEKKHVLYQSKHSVITSYLGVIHNHISESKENIVGINTSAGDLYLFAFKGLTGENLHRNRILLEVDSETRDCIMLDNLTIYKTGNPEAIEWLKRNGYCFQLTIPQAKPSTRYTLMLADLNTFFGEKLGIEGKLFLRNVKCNVLIRKKHVEALRSERHIAQLHDDPAYFKMENKPISSLIHCLATKYFVLSKIPFIDETDITFNVDMELQANLCDIGEINGALEQYGLTLIETTRELNMVVITDKNTNKQQVNP